MAKTNMEEKTCLLSQRKQIEIRNILSADACWMGEHSEHTHDTHLPSEKHANGHNIDGARNKMKIALDTITKYPYLHDVAEKRKINCT